MSVLRASLLRVLAPPILLSLLLAASAAAQWPFDPAGHLYPKDEASKRIDHVTLLSDGARRYGSQAAGLYTSTGRLHRFAFSRIHVAPDNSRILWEFETEAIDGENYQFAGQFYNNHVYEEYVTDPKEVVASGTLRMYEGGKLLQEVPVEWTYLPKLRSAMSDVNVPYPSGKTDLMLAACKGDDLARVRELLRRGARVNASGPGGLTAIECAVRGDHPTAELVGLLLAAGADVNKATDSGTTPLMDAADQDDASIVRLLIATGADVNARSKDGYTALSDAVAGVAAGTGSVENVRALLRAGDDVNAKDKSGRTALSIARAAHDDETVAILLAAGAKD